MQKIARSMNPTAGKTVQLFIFLLLSFFLLLAFIFKRSVWVLAFLLTAISVAWYGVSRSIWKDSDVPMGKGWMRANIYFGFANIGVGPYCALMGVLGEAPAVTVLLAIIGIVIAVAGVFVFQISLAGEKFFKALDEGNLVNLKAGEQTLNPGDVVLCDSLVKVEAKEKDTRIILPLLDRFLHMLLIGPTGAGKTSQVLLPLAYQDIKNRDVGITLIEPKGDFAQKVAMMAKNEGRPYLYFDPTRSDCPFFNPLVGDETEVIENAVTTFLMLDPDSPQFFKDLSELLIRNTLKVLKRLDKDKGIDGYYSTFIWMSRVLQNNGGQGRELVVKFSRISSSTPDEAKENADIASWFLNEYFMERSKVYENSSGIRSQVSKVIANRYLRRVLNPNVEKGEYNQIDFDKHLEEGGVICICTAQGAMRSLSKFLGYFIILQFQSAVFRRPGTEDTRRPNFLYIDEFQTYSTPGFSDMLTQGRSYRVASILATQGRSQIAMGGGRDGKHFLDLVSSNARNVVIFPGINEDDALYYSRTFGEHMEVQETVGIIRKRFSLITGGLDRLGHPSESIRTQEQLVPNFTTTDIRERDFGQIICQLINHNSIQPAQAGLVKWLDKDYNALLNRMIEEDSLTKEMVEARESANNEPEFDFASSFDFSSDAEQQPAPTSPKPAGLSFLGEEPASEPEEKPARGFSGSIESFMTDDLI